MLVLLKTSIHTLWHVENMHPYSKEIGESLKEFIANSVVEVFNNFFEI